MSDLPLISDEALDGEKYSIKLEDKKCPHEMELVSSNHVRCLKCGAGWTGPQAFRLYEEWKRHQTT